jgi:unsaturated rhamnogalacturonyl hydrolase
MLKISSYTSMLRLLSFCFAFFLSTFNASAQVNVGLDNWFNHETNVKTGQPYHYLWSDTADSGYSRWGKIFTDKGAKISQINQPLKEELAKIQIYIIVDPDTTSENPNPNYILPQDVKAIKAWVKKGGVLMILANDAPNCEFTHLNQLANTFGINFNHVSLHPVVNKKWEMGAFSNLPGHPVFKNVSKIYLKEISSFTLTGKATPVLTENGTVFMAESKYGKGWIFAVGDPWIYNEYMDHERLPADFTNRAAAESLTDYLIQKTKRK